MLQYIYPNGVMTEDSPDLAACRGTSCTSLSRTSWRRCVFRLRVRVRSNIEAERERPSGESSFGSGVRALLPPLSSGGSAVDANLNTEVGSEVNGAKWRSHGHHLSSSVVR
jgi:hypothetical protein